MARSIIKAILGLSFLFVLILSLIFLYSQTLQASSLYPKDVEKWHEYYTTYLIILLLGLVAIGIYAPRVIRKLATANYWKTFFLRFIPVALVSLTVLVLLQGIFKGPGSIDLFKSISYMTLTVLLFHMVVVSQIEELIFGGLIYTALEKKNGKISAEIFTVFTFAGFHYAKSGGNLIVMATYIPLRFLFNYVRNNGIPILGKTFPTLFGATPITQQANAGLHFAWNMFVIGFIEPFRNNT